VVGKEGITVTSSPTLNPSSGANPLAGIFRCIRRICVLREQGKDADASLLERNDFANAVRDFRLTNGPDALPESELQSMFALEERRVADAAVLSELLIPELVKSFPPIPVAGAPRLTSASPTVPDSSTPPFPRAAAAAGVSPIIADLLDAMLASERAGRRP
jgi:hypothetical protein